MPGSGLVTRCGSRRTLGVLGFSLIAALAMCITAVPPVAAATHPSGALPRILSAPHSVKAGSEVVVSVDVKRGAACRLTVASRARGALRSAAGHAVTDELEFVWTVPRHVAPGGSTATVQCRGTRHLAHTRIVAVAVHRRTSRELLARHIHVITTRSTEPAELAEGLGGINYPHSGTPLVNGTEWLGGHGVTVYSNGCAGCDSYSSDAYGLEWQCVELFERLINQENWYHGVVPGNANELYRRAPTSAFEKHLNSSGYIPQPGDAIVLGSGTRYGHVAIVDHIAGNTVYVVEQNASPTGWDSLTLNGSTLGTLEGMSVIGVLHAKNDPYTNSTAVVNPITIKTPPSNQSTCSRPNSAGYEPPCNYVPHTYQVYGTGSEGLYQRTGPGTTYPHASTVLPNGAAVAIACQVKSSSSVNGSAIWDLLTDGYYVSDYYINTPDVGTFTPGISQCEPG